MFLMAILAMFVGKLCMTSGQLTEKYTQTQGLPQTQTPSQTLTETRCSSMFHIWRLDENAEKKFKDIVTQMDNITLMTKYEVSEMINPFN